MPEPNFPKPDALCEVETIFEKNFAEREEIGASVSVWKDGIEVLHLSRGHRDRKRSLPWGGNTIAPFWSATKGLAAASTLMALDEAGHSLDEPVVSVWPEFGGGGKKGVSFTQVLSHQAGVPAVDKEVTMFDYDAVVTAIETQAPLWFPGTKHGYHSRMFGFLLDEIVRRVSGAESLGEYWREKFAIPFGLDLWIGLPTSEHARVAELTPGKLRDTGEETAFYQAFAKPGSLSRRTFGSPGGLGALTGMNEPEAMQAGFPALGGVGSARALAKFYSLFATVSDAIPNRIHGAASNALVNGEDAVLLLPTSFAAGFMMDPVNLETEEKRRAIFGSSKKAFGHPGAGGSLGFADPENGIAFAYVMNHLSYGVLPNVKAREMVDAIYT